MHTGFALPFDVLRSEEPLLSARGAARLSIALVDAAAEDAVTAIASIVHLFAAVANVGALAGSTIPPHLSGIGTVAEAHSSVPGTLHFELGDCRVDERALVPLSDALLHERRVSALSTVALYGTGVLQRLTNGPSAHSTYPGRYQALPFELSDLQPESGAYTFTIELHEPLLADSRTELERYFGLWRSFVLEGAFALAPIPPASNYLEPDDPFIDYDNVVEWTVFKLRAHPASLDSLVNVIAAFAERCQPVTRVTIS